MKRVPITITMPENLINELKDYLGNRKISYFVTEAVTDRLEKKQSRHDKIDSLFNMSD